LIYKEALTVLSELDLNPTGYKALTTSLMNLKQFIDKSLV